MRPIEEFELFDQCAYTVGVNQYGTRSGDTGCGSATARSMPTDGGPQPATKTEESWSSQTGSSYG